MPYSFLDQEGQPRGILVDLWRLYADKNNIDVEFKLVDWADSIDLVRTGAAHVHGGLNETKIRKKGLFFSTTEIIHIRTLAFINEDIEFRDLAELTSVLIGVIASSSAEEFLRTNISKLTLKPYPNDKLMVESAVSGEVDVFVSDYPTGYYHLISLESLDRFDTGPALYTRPILAATKQSDGALLDRISASTKKPSRHEIERIRARWLIPEEPMPAWLITDEQRMRLHAVATTPAQGLRILPCSVPQPSQPSLHGWAGQPVQRPFRGLLSVHSRYGLHTRWII